MSNPQEPRDPLVYPAYPPPQYQQQGAFAAPYLPPHPGYQMDRPAHSNGMSVAGFVTGLLGLLLFWIPGLGLILGSLGIIFGSVAISAARKVGSSRGLAIAGLVLGILAVIPGVLVFLALAGAGSR